VLDGAEEGMVIEREAQAGHLTPRLAWRVR